MRHGRGPGRPARREGRRRKACASQAANALASWTLAARKLDSSRAGTQGRRTGPGGRAADRELSSSHAIDNLGGKSARKCGERQVSSLRQQSLRGVKGLVHERPPSSRARRELGYAAASARQPDPTTCGHFWVRKVTNNAILCTYKTLTDAYTQRNCTERPNLNRRGHRNSRATPQRDHTPGGDPQVSAVHTRSRPERSTARGGSTVRRTR